jgi:hypothetical protein
LQPSQLPVVSKYYDHGTATPPLSEQNSMTRYPCHLATKIAAVSVGTIATTYVFLFAYSNLSKYGFSGTWNLIWEGGECDQQIRGCLVMQHNRDDLGYVPRFLELVLIPYIRSCHNTNRLILNF